MSGRVHPVAWLHLEHTHANATLLAGGLERGKGLAGMVVKKTEVFSLDLLRMPLKGCQKNHTDSGWSW